MQFGLHLVFIISMIHFRQYIPRMSVSSPEKSQAISRFLINTSWFHSFHEEDDGIDSALILLIKSTTDPQLSALHVSLSFIDSSYARGGSWVTFTISKLMSGAILSTISMIVQSLLTLVVNSGSEQNSSRSVLSSSDFPEMGWSFLIDWFLYSYKFYVKNILPISMANRY